jgi:chemotaxis protein methyltransferase CheR
MVTFASLNLIEDDYPAIHNNTVNMDLILCRNVTIYFTEAATRQVVKRFYEALENGGWLAVGHAEPSLMVYRAFQTRTFPNTVLYQKTGQPQPWPDDWEQLDDSGQMEPSPTIATWSQAGPNLPVGPPEISTATNGKSSTASPPATFDLYESARTQLDKGYIKEAIETLQGKLAEEPDFAPAYCLLGRAYANMGRWAEAQHWCQSALERDRLLPEAYYVLGLVYQHEDDLKSAIDMLKKAIYLDRQAPLPHFNLAMLYKKLGQLKNAQRAFQNTIKTLEKWPSAAVIPDSGGATAKHLLDISRRILNELTTKR